MALLGSWQFSTATTTPPVTGQLRLNTTIQKNATLMWVHKVNAVGGDMTTALSAIKKDEELRVQDDDEPTKWNTWAVTTNPTVLTNHFEFSIVWVRGGLDLTQQRVTLEQLPPGNQRVLIEPLPALQAHTAAVAVKGQMMTFDYAYPFEGRSYTSPGLTKRQWYAGMAMQGFISSQANPANLIGTLAPYAFKIADSMIAQEQKESEGVLPPIVGAGPRRVA